MPFFMPVFYSISWYHLIFIFSQSTFCDARFFDSTTCWYLLHTTPILIEVCSLGESHSSSLFPDSADLSLPSLCPYVSLSYRTLLSFNVLILYCSFSHNSLRYICFLLYLVISNVFGAFWELSMSIFDSAFFGGDFLCPYVYSTSCFSGFSLCPPLLSYHRIFSIYQFLSLFILFPNP